MCILCRSVYSIHCCTILAADEPLWLFPHTNAFLYTSVRSYPRWVKHSPQVCISTHKCVSIHKCVLLHKCVPYTSVYFHTQVCFCTQVCIATQVCILHKCVFVYTAIQSLGGFIEISSPKSFKISKISSLIPNFSNKPWRSLG